LPNCHANGCRIRPAGKPISADRGNPHRSVASVLRDRESNAFVSDSRVRRC
jgi:hypothetical protein